MSFAIQFFGRLPCKVLRKFPRQSRQWLPFLQLRQESCSDVDHMPANITKFQWWLSTSNLGTTFFTVRKTRGVCPIPP